MFRYRLDNARYHLIKIKVTFNFASKNLSTRKPSGEAELTGAAEVAAVSTVSEVIRGLAHHGQQSARL